ncbi:MAG: hypothetical protein WCS83_03505 [Endomicrobiia bacterium]|jgi:hypothetical protein|nr:hypothetical protein [Endomicrobiaceae bacterium]MDD3052981.1 hypothetical protein [Endomicrobiaceae bacterium]MDD3923296.1 hypothetical protein [Endomicrobiaceae bacterium]MDD5101691.1 hypothetical protein [Endomicrobiaceae bacterium]
MDNEDVKNEENQKDTTKEEKTYDKVGLLIGGVFGILLSLFGIIDFLMGITVGMFLGLLIGTFIKK